MIISNNNLRNFQSVFISPNTACNLDCQMCYVKKDQHELSYQEVIYFINKVDELLPLRIITLCGGEVFLLDYMTKLINYLTNKGIIVEIITNGTFPKLLSEIKQPNNVNLIISIDGLRNFHDLNRGIGCFTRTINYAKLALKLLFHVEINTIVCRENYETINEFELKIQSLLERKIPINYHIKKNKSYLKQHFRDNICKNTTEFHDLLPNQINKLYYKKSKVFPPKQLNCYQLSLMSDGLIYSCCESQGKLGDITNPISQIVGNYCKIVTQTMIKKQKCIQNDFMCGLKKYFTSSS